MASHRAPELVLLVQFGVMPVRAKVLPEEFPEPRYPVGEPPASVTTEHVTCGWRGAVNVKGLQVANTSYKIK